MTDQPLPDTQSESLSAEQAAPLQSPADGQIEAASAGAPVETDASQSSMVPPLAAGGKRRPRPSRLSDEQTQKELEQEERQRRRLMLFLLVLLLLLCCVCVMFYLYWRNPRPLPALLPKAVNVNYPPHYLFSIYGADQPVGVAVSPQGDIIYVAETGGKRLLKAFDRDGTLLFSFAPPTTSEGERSPVYLAVDKAGRVFVTDRLQHAIFIYDRDGKYLDTILDYNTTLTEYLSKHLQSSLPAGATYSYNLFKGDVNYQFPGKQPQTLPAPDRAKWSPLGLRFDNQYNLWFSDLPGDRHTIREIPTNVISQTNWTNFESNGLVFGIYGQGNGQFLYPNMAALDSQNQIYVSDGNNSRISVWDNQGNFLFDFGKGTGDGALSLPRGVWIDYKDRLHVVDAVGQDVKVYDVSGPEPIYLYTFGGWGIDDGLFNYPNDITIDSSGRLYVTDRENNRVQVWSY